MMAQSPLSTTTISKSVIPLKEDDDYYTSLNYSPNQTYYCYDWLSSYMEYYNSLTDTSTLDPAPSLLENILRTKAIEANKAMFVLDLYPVRIFEKQTPEEVIEQYYNSSSISKYDLSAYDKYLKTNVLTSLGIVLPNHIEDLTDVTIALPDSRLANIVDKISFFNYQDQLLGGIIPDVNDIMIQKKYLNLLKVKVDFKNGVVLNFNLKPLDCEHSVVNLSSGSSTSGAGGTNTVGTGVDGPIIVEGDNQNPTYQDENGDPSSHPPLGDPEPPTLDECDIQPSYFNNPANGQPYNAQFSFPQLNPDFTYTVQTPIYLPSNTYNIIIGYTTTVVSVMDPYESTLNPGVHGPIGQVKTAVYLNPKNSKVTKPIIITDGIDFDGTRTYDKLFKSFGGNSIITLLWDGGYDVIFADFKGGADFMQRNSYALVELIRSLRFDQDVEEIEALIGPSMGGQVARHALLFWEKSLIGQYGDHKVKRFITADSPWEGANIAPAIQTMGYIYENESDAAMKIKVKINSPASRQLLLNHVNNSNFNFIESACGSGNYNFGPHQYRTAWIDEIETLGDTPKKCDKLIAIADGSGSGGTQSAAASEILEFKFIDFGFFSTLGIYGYQHFYSIEDSGNEKLLKKSICKTGLYNIHNNAGSKEFDSANGSPYDLTKDIASIDGLKIKHGKIEIDIDRNKIKPFTFIPTFSALGLSQSSMTDNFFSLTTPNGAGFTMTSSRFDAVFFDNRNSAHTSMSLVESPGSVPFLLQELQWVKENDTKCDMMSNGAMNDFLAFEKIQLSAYAPSSFCIPFPELKITNISGNYCNFVFEQSGSQINISTQSPYDCHELVTFCFKLPNCPTEICKQIEINYNYSGNKIKNAEHPQGLEASESNSHILSNTLDKNSSHKINISPNPASSIIHIDCSLKDYKFTLSDVNGRVLINSQNEKSADVSHLATGLYFGSIISTDGAILSNQKIFIIR